MSTHARPVQSRGSRTAEMGVAIAVVFILFDLETVFLYLWALAATPLTGFMLVTFALFTLLLVLIMLYVWRSGLLEEVTT